MCWRREGLMLITENIKATGVFSLLPCGGGFGSWDDQLPSLVLIHGFGKSVSPSSAIIHLITLCVRSQASKLRKSSFQAAFSRRTGRRRNSIYSLFLVRNSRKVG